MDLCLEPVDFKLLDLSVNYLFKKGLSIPENKVQFQKGQSLAEFLARPSQGS